MELPTLVCDSCGHTWNPRTSEPMKCPVCGHLRSKTPETNGNFSELQELQSEFAGALDQGFRTGLLRVFKLKQDNNERLFYPLKETSDIKPLKTTVNALCLRDDLAVYDVKMPYTNVANMGMIKEPPTFKLIEDPKAVGIDVTETVKLVRRIIKDFPSKSEGGE